MAFGKRPVTASASAPQGGHRVIPAEMRDDSQVGSMLRDLGFDPDDESNLAPNSQSIDEKLAHGRAAVDAKVAKLNADLRAKGGGALRPFFLLPDPCWNGEMGHLLMVRLDLSPFDDWNVAFLPADERTALCLDMPLHPNGNIPAFVRAASKFLDEADAHLRAALDETTRTQDVVRFEHTREEIRNRVRGLAHNLLGQLDNAWKQKRLGRA